MPLLNRERERVPIKYFLSLLFDFAVSSVREIKVSEIHLKYEEWSQIFQKSFQFFFPGKSVRHLRLEKKIAKSLISRISACKSRKFKFLSRRMFYVVKLLSLKCFFPLFFLGEETGCEEEEENKLLDKRKRRRRKEKIQIWKQINLPLFSPLVKSILMGKSSKKNPFFVLFNFFFKALIASHLRLFSLCIPPCLFFLFFAFYPLPSLWHLDSTQVCQIKRKENTS